MSVDDPAVARAVVDVLATVLDDLIVRPASAGCGGTIAKPAASTATQTQQTQQTQQTHAHRYLPWGRRREASASSGTSGTSAAVPVPPLIAEAEAEAAAVAEPGPKPTLLQRLLRGYRDSCARTHATYHFVLMFRLGAREGETHRNQREIEERLQALLRPGLELFIEGSSKFGGVLVAFVRLPQARMVEEWHRATLSDWLNGVGRAMISDVAPDTFTTAQQLRLCHNVLSEADCLGQDFESDPLLHATFPLHDRAFNVRWLLGFPPAPLLSRVLLSEGHLDEIRDQYGEEVAFYFAFLNYYLYWLVPPAVLGVVLFVVLGAFSMVHALATVLWATLFFFFWRRRAAALAHRWGTQNFSHTERVRRTFRRQQRSRRSADDFMAADRDYPGLWRHTKRVLTIPLVLLSYSVVVAVVALIMLSEVLLKDVYRGPLHQYTKFIPTVLFAALVPQLNRVYQSVAVRLNDWEDYRTDSEYGQMLVRKLFLFNFFTAYFVLFFLATVYVPFADEILAFMGRYVDINPDIVIGRDHLVTKLATILVTGQIISFVNEVILPFVKGTVKANVSQIKEQLARRRQRRRAQRDAAAAKQMAEAEDNADDADDASTAPGVAEDTAEDEAMQAHFLSRVLAEAEQQSYEPTADYTEMVVQFGYVTLFSVVWPFAPLAALINNLVEIRADPIKIALAARKAVPLRADGIGAWADLIAGLAWMGAVVEVALALFYGPYFTAPSGTFFADVVLAYSPFSPAVTKLVLVVALEHVFFALWYFCENSIDAVPWEVKEDMRRQEYHVKQRLASNRTSAPGAPAGMGVVVEDEVSAAAALNRSTGGRWGGLGRIWNRLASRVPHNPSSLAGTAPVTLAEPAQPETDVIEEQQRWEAARELMQRALKRVAVP